LRPAGFPEWQSPRSIIALSPRGGINVKETKRMVGVNKPMAKRIAGALAFGLAVSTLATPSLAQRAEGPMSGTREKASRVGRAVPGGTHAVPIHKTGQLCSERRTST